MRRIIVRINHPKLTGDAKLGLEREDIDLLRTYCFLHRLVGEQVVYAITLNEVALRVQREGVMPLFGLLGYGLGQKTLRLVRTLMQAACLMPHRRGFRVIRVLPEEQLSDSKRSKNRMVRKHEVGNNLFMNYGVFYQDINGFFIWGHLVLDLFLNYMGQQSVEAVQMLPQYMFLAESQVRFLQVKSQRKLANEATAAPVIPSFPGGCPQPNVFLPQMSLQKLFYVGIFVSVRTDAWWLWTGQSATRELINILKPSM